MSQAPNEGVVFLRRGLLRRSYLVSFDTLDRPIGILTKRIDVAPLVSLKIGDPRVAFAPETLATPAGALHLGAVNLTVRDERVATRDGLSLYALASVSFRLKRRRKALAKALEQRVFATFAVDLANRVKAVLADAVGQERQADAIARQARIEERVRAALAKSTSVRRIAAIDDAAVRLSDVGPEEADGSAGGGGGDIANDLRRAARVFDERGVPVGALELRELARAFNDRDKLRVLANAKAPVVIVPAEGSGLITPEFLDEVRDARTVAAKPAATAPPVLVASRAGTETDAA